MSADAEANRPVRRIAQIIRLRPEYVEKYKACHAAVWPEILASIRECDIEDYSIFLDEDTLTLFASFKYTGSDFEADMKKMAAGKRMQEWWAMTDSMQQSLVPGATGSTGTVPWWKELKEVFYTE